MDAMKTLIHRSEKREVVKFGINKINDLRIPKSDGRFSN